METRSRGSKRGHLRNSCITGKGRGGGANCCKHGLLVTVPVPRLFTVSGRQLIDHIHISIHDSYLSWLLHLKCFLCSHAFMQESLLCDRFLAFCLHSQLSVTCFLIISQSSVSPDGKLLLGRQAHKLTSVSSQACQTDEHFFVC